MANEKLVFTIQVNTDTGQIGVVNDQLKNISSTADNTSKSFLGLSNDASVLAKSFLTIKTIRAVGDFLNSSIQNAEEFRESLRKVSFSLDATGTSFSNSNEKITEWAQTIQETTKYSDNQALDSLSQLIRVTNNFAQAQSAVNLIMDLASSTNLDYQSAQTAVIDLINGNTKALIPLKREFSGLIGNTKDTQEILDILSEKFRGAAKEEDTLTKKQEILKNKFQDLKKTIGEDLIPIWEKFIDISTKSMDPAISIWNQIHEKVKTTVAGIRSMIVVATEKNAEEQSKRLIEIWDSLEQKFAEKEEQKTVKVQEEEEKRILLNKYALEERKRLLEEERLKEEEENIKREENTLKTLVGQHDAHIRAFDDWKKTEETKAKIEKKNREAALADTVDNLKELSKHSAEAFEVYKAFAIIQTIISTYEGAQKAFTSLAGIPIVGPELGAAAAAIAIAAGMSRVSAITSQQRPAYKTGGTIYGTGEVPIIAHGGEEVINASAASRNRALLKSINQGANLQSASTNSNQNITVNVNVSLSFSSLSIDNSDAIINSLAASIARESSNAVKLAVQITETGSRNSRMAV